MKTVVLNHKSFLSYEEIEHYKNELELIKKDNINLILMPNIAYLSSFKNTTFTLGSQNFYSYNFGSYTGETSLEILKSLDVEYTLVGHPERITLKLDAYEEIKDKLFKSLNSDFKTILCIGHDESINTVKKELKYYLKGIEGSSIKNLIIAFEPSSKIDGDTVNLKDIQYLKDFIKEYMEKNYKEDIPFFYGGGINKDNINDVLEIVDGIVLGKISTNIEKLKEILNQINIKN